MILERRDWWWTIGMLIVCGSIANKGGLVRTGEGGAGFLGWRLFGTSNFATHQKNAAEMMEQAT
jgi:hypothetical protein